MPEYAVKHEGIMVLFKASKPSKAPKHQAAALDEALDEALEKEIIKIIKKVRK